MRILSITFAAALCIAALARAENSTSEPRPIPLTRPEMKQYLEDMKQRTPRIPLPELTDAQKAELGERSGGYESRLRSTYMPRGNERFSFNGGGGSRTGGTRPDGARPEGTPPGGARPDGARPDGARPGGGFGRDNEPGMTLDYRFKVSLFWIVSRTNNCQYCLGHQESKLLSAGMTEDEIAGLDGDWKQFKDAEQSAFAFARKFTLQPHLLSDADIAALKKHYTDLQILEMILSMAGNNSINRWKEGVGVPQSSGGGGFGRRTEGTAATEPAAPSREHSYLTPTSEKFQTSITLVAPLLFDDAGKATRKTVLARPALESRTAVEEALAAARQRSPRLPLVEEAKALELLGEDAPKVKGPLPQWARLLLNFPQSGKRSVSSSLFADDQGDLTPLLKAQVSWIIARQDRAWYATGQAQRRLKDLGQTADQIYALDGNWDDFSPKERALFTVAKKLAASPVVLTDDEVAAAVKLAGPRDVVQVVSYTTNRASFDRITEAAGLQIEP